MPVPEPLPTPIPEGKPVQINSLVYSLHINSPGFVGNVGNAFLFDDKDKAHYFGEEWIFTRKDDGYTIKNANTLEKNAAHPVTYLTTQSHADFEYPLLYVGTSEKVWIVRPSGLFDSFSLHPADNKSLAVGFHTPGPQSAALWVEPFNSYLNQLWKIDKSTGTVN
jgi:hypothetical protein